MRRNGVARGRITAVAQAGPRIVGAWRGGPTNVTATTIILIAYDGEWTRRAAGSRESAFDLARSLEVPVYDVLQTGYPARMREWNSRQRRRD